MKKKCAYCGNEFELLSNGQKYCSAECHRLRNNEWLMNKNREGKTRICPICNSEIPKFKSKYCSDKCSQYAVHVSRGVCLDHGLLTKTCPVCGKEFQTFKSRKITCSDECSRKRHNSYDPEKERKRYLKKHPDARTMADISRESKEKKEIKRANYEKWLAAKEIEWAENRAKKEAQKQANIAYWLEYEAEHECAVCGNKFIAHYPTTKYCSDKCSRAKYRDKRKFGGASVKILARRDNDICQLCGLKVDWTDKKVLPDGNVICGKMYPSRDHIIPKSLGGTNDLGNLQLAHIMCNSRKGNRFIG